jgi:hypothetical protein
VTDDCEINDICYPLRFLDSSCIRRIVIEMPSTQPVRLNYQDRFDSMLEKRLSPGIPV